MKNFQVYLNIGEQQVCALLHELSQHAELWNQYPLRTNAYGGPSGEVSDIILQYNNPLLINTAQWDEFECISYPPFLLLPKFQQMVMATMATFKGERLGRAFIAKLPPGGHIAPHVDGLRYCSYYKRYHIALQDNPNTLWRCGDEYFAPSVGDVYSVDNSKEHEVFNDGSEERITLVVDIKKPVLFTGEVPRFKVEKVNGDLVATLVEEAPKRKRGRPPGSKNKKKPRRKGKK